MPILIKKISKQEGWISRTLVHIENKKTDKVQITVVAGTCGMNFKYMPELEWR